MRPLPLSRLPLLVNAFVRLSLRKPTFVSFNVSNRCNERCPMCQVWREALPELSLEEMRPLFAGLRRFGFAVVEVAGGEPFLRKDLFGIFSLLEEMSFLYSATTNGTVLTDEVVDRLRGTKNLLQLGVSIDSLDPALYARLRGRDLLPVVLEGLKRLRRARLPFLVKLNVTVSRHNHREVPALLDFAQANGFYLSAFPVNQGEGFSHRHDDPSFVPAEEEREEIAQLFRDLARRRRRGEPLWEFSGFYELAADYALGRPVGPCDAGRIYADLSSDGQLSTCLDHEGVADLRKLGIEEAWKRLGERKAQVDACSSETPCCYTCTFNVSVTARNPIAYALEMLRLRQPPRPQEGRETP